MLQGDDKKRANPCRIGLNFGVDCKRLFFGAVLTNES